MFTEIKSLTLTLQSSSFPSPISLHTPVPLTSSLYTYTPTQLSSAFPSSEVNGFIVLQPFTQGINSHSPISSPEIPKSLSPISLSFPSREIRTVLSIKKK
ncbi:hypothetical protein QL285_009222 [Trifolium repens]|nr:hypothetical protein QL285_009222 [Trifolium repens]